MTDMLGVIVGVLVGGIITFLVSRYYYRKSIQPDSYLNGVLENVEPRPAAIAKRLLEAESRGDKTAWVLEGEFESTDLYGPFFQVVDYATPDDAPGAAELRLTPLGRLVALFLERQAQLAGTKTSPRTGI
ncbi:MAG: hypothetical protein ACREX3_14035 [Gammaproteobacteria bacterium]